MTDLYSEWRDFYAKHVNSWMIPEFLRAECGKLITTDGTSPELLLIHAMRAMEELQAEVERLLDALRHPALRQRVWNCPPTKKPVALMEYLIKNYSNEGDVVLDFAAGSGTTGVDCVNTNRDFIGIEKDEGYFKIAKDRIETAKHDLYVLQSCS